MSLDVFDTDTLSLYGRGQGGLCARIDAHVFSELAITVITVEEDGGTLVTRNLRDFRRIPNLAIEDWTA